MRRGFIALAFCLAAAACSGGDNAADSAAAENEADLLADRFIGEEGEDIDSCFADLPDLQDRRASATFAGSQDEMTAGDAAGVVVAIDASGSMAGQVRGETKMEAAKAAAREFLAGLPDDVAVGLVAFGHRGDNSAAGKAASCAAVETLYPLGSVDRGAVTAALGQFGARGWTPLAAAIQIAGKSFVETDQEGAQVVYVVSDGEETCGGDPVAAARALHVGGTRAIVNVIGFDLAASDRAQLRAVAEAGGGSFVEARTGDDLRRAGAEARRALRNSGTMARTSLSNTADQAQNSLRTSGEGGRLSLCVSAAVGREALRQTSWLSEAVPEPALRDAVADRLERRREAYRQRAKDWNDTAQRRRDAVNDVIQSRQDATRERYEAVR